MSTILERFEKALDATKSLDTKYPGEPMLNGIILQVEFIIKCLKEDKNPTKETDKEFNFGLLAMRSVNEFDEKLANELAELADWIDTGAKGN